jgi:D-amino-acid dehydrogenase
MKNDKNVTVIGAGIVGIATAAYLQREGFAVTVIDERPPGEGCSFGNAGILSPSACVPIAEPGMLWKVPGYLGDPLGPLAVRPGYFPAALPWFIRFLLAGRRKRVVANSRAMAALYAKCLDAYQPLVGDAGEPGIITQSGALLVSKEKGKSEMRSGLANDLRDAAGIKAEALGPEELCQLDPALSPDFKGGILFPNTAHSLNSFRLVQLLAARVTQNGGQILRRRVTGFVHGMEGPTALRTEEGDLAVDRLVIAAGAWSRGLAAQLGTEVPLEAERGYHVTLPNPGIAPRLPVSYSGRGFYATPMESGLRFAGTAEFAGIDAPPDYRRAKVLLRLGQDMYPALKTEDAREWMGCRPSFPDSLPVIDRSPRFAKVHFAFGHSHWGLMGAAITGRLISQLVAGKLPEIDLAPYRATRF